jgi:maleylacetoacetate isomerase
MPNTRELTLYDYWRSSACYRVRIALNLKGMEYTARPVHLLNNGGEQHSAEHRTLNPQETIPVLVDGARVIRQSLAILEYLDEVHPDQPLLPAAARDRAHVRGLAQLVACDIHPLNNLRVMQYIEREYGVQQPAREQWMRHWMEEGLRAFEAILDGDAATGMYCHGDSPTMADVCLIPQVYNAKRFDIDLSQYPMIQRIDEQCLSVAAFDSARPERQPDAPPT